MIITKYSHLQLFLSKYFGTEISKQNFNVAFRGFIEYTF
jgi:hypothetical protein